MPKKPKKSYFPENWADTLSNPFHGVEVFHDWNGRGSNIYDVHYPALFLGQDHDWEAPERVYRIVLPFIPHPMISTRTLKAGLTEYRKRFNADPNCIMLMHGAGGHGILFNGTQNPRDMQWPPCPTCGTTRPAHKKTCRTQYPLTIRVAGRSLVLDAGEEQVLATVPRIKAFLEG